MTFCIDKSAPHMILALSYIAPSLMCVLYCLPLAAYKHADGKKIDGRRVLVDVERGRTVKGWRPRRLGRHLCFLHLFFS